MWPQWQRNAPSATRIVVPSAGHRGCTTSSSQSMPGTLSQRLMERLASDLRANDAFTTNARWRGFAKIVRISVNIVGIDSTH